MMSDIIFNPRTFTSNLTHNLEYFFIGRHTGLLGYFFPAVFAIGAFLLAPRQRPAWQWLVLGAGLLQGLVFFISPLTRGTVAGSAIAIFSVATAPCSSCCPRFNPPPRRSLSGRSADCSLRRWSSTRLSRPFTLKTTRRADRCGFFQWS